MTAIYILLGVLALGFLIFIHELGHYWMARRVGMRVEVFSIGMGASLMHWMHKGVKWQIGWIPFGGYVRIAGTEKEGELEPYQIPDGFFGKKPIDRIKVALMGPIVNLVFAFLVFVTLWATGGREKPFGDFTARVGYLDKHSPLYEEGVRPGDRILSYDSYPIHKSRDHLFATMLGGDQVDVKGEHWDKEQPFHLSLAPYPHPYAQEEGLKTLGVLSPASYLLVQEDPSTSGGPAKDSGLQKGDRIIWANGEMVFSVDHLRELLNKPQVWLTIERNGKKMGVQVPLYPVEDYRLSQAQQGELDDWRHDLGLQTPLSSLIFFPYELDPEAVVERPYQIIGESQDQKILRAGDRILAVNGMPVQEGEDALKLCQEAHANLIVVRDPADERIVSWDQADTEFHESIAKQDLQALIHKIGDGQSHSEGQLYLLAPVAPKPQMEFALSVEERAEVEKQYAELQAQVQAMPAGAQKEASQKVLERIKHERLLGVHLGDRLVRYNPTPFVLFGDVIVEVWRTLQAVSQGSLHPKWMSGPVGIVRVMHFGWSIGIKEALFWMAVISLNLGILNLLPIPVLDGGNICFSLWEMVTKKPLKARTMELLIIPFIVLIVGFFLFVTYNDLARLFGF